MLSIITSLYRSERHLPGFIRKIKNMSVRLERAGIEHEFIILLNNPTDKEVVILKNLPPKAKLVSRNLETLYASWNKGVEIAAYNNICFWNVDDSRFFRALVFGIDKLNNGADIVYFPFIYFRFLKIRKIKILAKIWLFIPPVFRYDRFIKEMHCGPFFMTTKKAFLKNGKFDDTFKVAGDYEWCVRATKNRLIFERNMNIGGIFTSDGTTLSGSKSLDHIRENQIVLNKYTSS